LIRVSASRFRLQETSSICRTDAGAQPQAVTLKLGERRDRDVAATIESADYRPLREHARGRTLMIQWRQ
jgi:hypothetical protein